MTTLSKELITTTPCASPQYTDELTVEKVPSDAFKELMQPEQEEEEASEAQGCEENASFTPFTAQQLCSPSFLQGQAQVHDVTACTQARSPSGALSLQIAELFEHMASTMLIMTTSEETETTLFLEGAKFSSSVFFGTRITIKEYTSAPKAFNVEIASLPAAANLMAQHKDALLAAFENAKFPFTVHRLE